MITKLVMLGETDAVAWDPHERLKRMDEFGTDVNIIYPNVGGFGSGRFLDLGEPDLMLECVQAYNDFLTDWCAADPSRLVGITALPFWDVAASVIEIERCAKFTTDFPHPTGQAPGPSSPEGKSARDFVEEALGDLPEKNLKKVLHSNAARVYHLA